MAQRGKTYPVAFRRDVSVNVRRTTGMWGKGLHAEFPPLLGTAGTALSAAADVYLIEVEPIMDELIRWEFGPRIMNGRHISVNITLKPDPMLDFFIVYQVRDSIQGVIYESGVQFQDKTGYETANTDMTFGSFPRPALLSLPGPGTVLKVRAIKWDVWNGL